MVHSSHQHHPATSMAAHPPEPPKLADITGTAIDTESLGGMKLAMFIASALVHANELSETLRLSSLGQKTLMLDPRVKANDAALRTVLDQPQVQAWLGCFEPGLLPEKRSKP